MVDPLAHMKNLKNTCDTFLTIYTYSRKKLGQTSQYKHSQGYRKFSWTTLKDITFKSAKAGSFNYFPTIVATFIGR